VVGGWGKLGRRTGCRFWVKVTGGGGGGGIGRCNGFAVTFDAFALYCRTGGGGGGRMGVKPLLAEGIEFGTGAELKVFS
jgi:hypothetical protein